MKTTLKILMCSISFSFVTAIAVSKVRHSAYSAACQKQTRDLRDAVKKGQVERIKALLKGSVDVNDREGVEMFHAGRTILTDAIDTGSFNVVKLLLDAGADVDAVAEVPHWLNELEPKVRNLPHISYAIMVGAPIKIIALLVQYSKDLNALDMHELGWTAYKVAKFYKNHKAMALLKEAGANTTIGLHV